MSELQTMTDSGRTISVDLNKIKNVSAEPPQTENDTSSGIIIISDPASSAVDSAEDDGLDLLQRSPYLNPDNSIYDLIRRSDYLQRFPSWLGYCGPDKKKMFPPTFIARNDTIWELIFSQRGYVDMLLMVRDLYLVPFPKFEADTSTGLPMDGAKLKAALFPGLDKLIDAHERILRHLLALHEQSEDYVVRSLGCCLVQLLDKPTQLSLSTLYGGFMFAQRRIREQLQLCKQIPVVASFFEKCRQDPRSARRSLEDCHMVIVQHWTKVETLLDAIIKNTLNQPTEVKNLETTKKIVHSLLKAAEEVMAVQEHAEKLAEFSRQFSPDSPDDPDDAYVRNIMKQSSTTLINYGSLRVSVGQTLVDVIGVALNDCFFVLQKSSDPDCGYRLFKHSQMPPILRWGQVYGYFRRAMIKSGFAFFILLQAESVLTLFQCSTVDELNRWESTINDGFAKWDAASSCTMEDLDAEWQKTRQSLSERWQNTEAVLTLLGELDTELDRAWQARTFVSLVLIEQRLRQMQIGQAKAQPEHPAAADSAYLSDNSLGVGAVRMRSGVEYDSGDSIQTPKTPGSLTGATNEFLEQHTFYSQSSVTDYLDQILVSFRELLTRLQFSLIGNSACLSRSASDVEERKRPQGKLLKKNETFSGRDIPKPSFDLKSLSERKSYSKKRDSSKLSSTMVNIFRSGSREKANPAQVDTSSFPVPTSAGGQLKGALARPPPSANSSTGSRTSLSSSSATPNFAARPSLSASVGEHPLQSGPILFSPNDSTDGSCNSLSSRPSVETLNLLKDLTELTESFFPWLFDLRTANEELRSRSRYLESEKNKLEDIYTRAKQHGFLNSNAGGPAGSENLTGGDGPSTFSVKQETEKLRQDVENFRKRSEEWEKEYKRQRDAVERDHAKLAREWARYDEANADLENRKHQYDEARKTLQQQLDLYARQGMLFTGITLPDIQLPTETTGPGAPTNQIRRASSNSLADLSVFSRTTADNRSNNNQNNNNNTVPVHTHSTSDDLTGQWARPSALFKDSRSRESTAPLDTRNEAGSRLSLTPTPSTRVDELPLHLRGSLVNQPVTGKPPSMAVLHPPTPSGRLPNAAAESPSASTSALYKLADSSKVHNPSKPKKSSIFRRG